MATPLINRYRSVLDYRQKQVQTSGLPTLLHLEPTNSCNLRCPMCPRTKDMERKVGFMSMSVVEKIAAEAEGHVQFVLLQAWGESVMHPQLDKIVANFKSRGIRTFLSTNATLLDANRSDKLLDSGLDLIIFSLDAVNEETYRQLRVGGDFQKTVKNVEEFLKKVRQRHIDMFCVCQLIYMSLNKHEALTFRKKWRELGAHVWLKPFNVWNGENEDFDKLHPDSAKKVYFDNLCDWPWRTMVIHWNGNVVPCCNDYDGDVVFGNVQQNTLAEVWNGEAIQSFRKAHIEGRRNIEFCKKCSYISLGSGKQLAFVLLNYLTSLKLQTRFENYYKQTI